MGFLSGSSIGGAIGTAFGGGVGGAIGSGIGGAIFGDRAADSMGDAQRSANALNSRQWEYIKGQASPFVSGANGAFQQLLQSYGAQQGSFAGQKPNFDFLTQSPDYQFAQQQGGQALDRSAAAKGRLYSGAQMQAQQQFGQGLASQTLGNYRQGLQGAAGLGMNALGTLANANQNYTNNAMQGLTNLGDINASRNIGYGNAIGPILGGGINALMQPKTQSSYQPKPGGNFGYSSGEMPSFR